MEENILKWENLICSLVARSGFPAQEWEDTKQILWLEVVKAVNRFDESKAPVSGLEGFVVFRLRGAMKTLKTERGYIRSSHRGQSVLRQRPKFAELADGMEPANREQPAERQTELRDRLARLFLHCEPLEIDAFALMALDVQNDQIAARLGCSRPMVSTHARRAAAKLHGSWEDVPPGALNGYVAAHRVKGTPAVEKKKPGRKDKRHKGTELFKTLQDWREAKFKAALRTFFVRAGKLSRDGMTVAEYNATRDPNRGGDPSNEDSGGSLPGQNAAGTHTRPAKGLAAR